MNKYVMTIEVEAEQFLPSEDKIPVGVISDGPRTPRTDSRAQWVTITNEGMQYLKEGDYIATHSDGSKKLYKQTEFEEKFKLLES